MHEESPGRTADKSLFFVVFQHIDPGITELLAQKHRLLGDAVSSKKKRRVVGYARVFTDMEDQQNSYAAQVDYYTNYIKSRDDWEFAGLYSDEGISACNTFKREGFNSMVADALDGKIEIFHRTLIQCPAHGSVGNGLK